MRAFLLSFVLLVLLGVIYAQRARYERYDEEVLVHVGTHSVTTHFQFTIDVVTLRYLPLRAGAVSHFTLFPKSLGSIISKFRIEELHLTFTSGRWEYERWGIPPVTSPHGAEFAISFSPDVQVHQLDEYWKGVSNAMSGLMCASLVYTSNPHQPTYNNTLNYVRQAIIPFRPESQTTDNPRGFHVSPGLTTVRHSMLYGEPVCTENLTPWLKMLPCRGQAGISSLFRKPWRLYEVDYHSLGLHYQPISLGSMYRLTLTLTLVSPVINSEWNAAKVFSADGIPRGCPIATTSNLYVSPSLEAEYFSVSTQLSKSAQEKDSDFFTFNLHAQPQNSSSFVVKYKDGTASRANAPASRLIEGNRWLIRWGQQNGKMAIFIHNKLPVSIRADYTQVVPWFMRLYYHTMEFYINDTLVPRSELAHILQDVDAQPATDHAWPGRLDLSVKLPMATRLMVAIEYENNFLHWAEFPPDAHRGFDIAPGIWSVYLDSNEVRQALLEERKRGFMVILEGLNWSPVAKERQKVFHSELLRIYTDGLVLTLPTPDFSMPYNVIMLTSTLWALFFGSMFNMLIRRYKELYKDGQFLDDRPITKIIRYICSLVKRNSPQATTQ